MSTPGTGRSAFVVRTAVWHASMASTGSWLRTRCLTFLSSRTGLFVSRRTFQASRIAGADRTWATARYHPTIRPYIVTSLRPALTTRTLLAGTNSLPAGVGPVAGSRSVSGTTDTGGPSGTSGGPSEPPNLSEFTDTTTWLDAVQAWVPSNPVLAAAVGLATVGAIDRLRNHFVDPGSLREAVFPVLGSIADEHPCSLAAVLGPSLEWWTALVEQCTGCPNFASGSIGTYFQSKPAREMLALPPTRANIRAQVNAEYDYYLAHEHWLIAKFAGLLFVKALRIAIWENAVITFRDSLRGDKLALFHRLTNNEWA
jgi:hypothetical protein